MYCQGVVGYMSKEEKQKLKSKRPFSKSDFEAVLQSATKPLKKQVEKESN